MAIDKAVDSSVLNGFFTAIANAIRRKNGSSTTYTPSQMPGAIDAISTGTQVKTDTGTVTFRNGTANLVLPFSPDIFTLTKYDKDLYNAEYTYSASFDFNISEKINNVTWTVDEEIYDFYAQRNQSTVNLASIIWDKNWSESGCSESFTYRAYKFI